MDLQKLMDALSESDMRVRSDYHATLGDLIDKLNAADDSARISPKVIGIGAYRGYYSDIALCTEGGSVAYKSELDYDSNIDWDKLEKENVVEIDFVENPKKLAEVLESLIGLYFCGYKGGYNKITREKPLWLAADYGNCSEIAVVGISDSLELITKKVD